MCIYIVWTCILIKGGDNEQCPKSKDQKEKYKTGAG